MRKIINSIVHFLGTTLGHTLGTTVFAFLLLWFKTVRDNVSFVTYFTSAKEWFSPLFSAVLFSMVLWLFVKLARITKQKESLESTLDVLGVKLVSEHLTESDKDLDWQLMQTSIKSTSNLSDLWILGATGKETFSKSNAPLCAVVKDYRKPIRVLLIRPYSKGFIRRTRDLGVNHDLYIDEILDSIDFCSDLKIKHGRDIELKVYSEFAIWKMLRTTDELWLQYYAPRIHVEDTPLYCFSAKKAELSEKSLYDAFASIFMKKWTEDHNSQIDLSTWKRNAADKSFWDSLV